MHRLTSPLLFLTRQPGSEPRERLPIPDPKPSPQNHVESARHHQPPHPTRLMGQASRITLNTQPKIGLRWAGHGCIEFCLGKSWAVQIAVAYTMAAAIAAVPASVVGMRNTTTASSKHCLHQKHMAAHLRKSPPKKGLPNVPRLQKSRREQSDPAKTQSMQCDGWTKRNKWVARKPFSNQPNFRIYV